VSNRLHARATEEAQLSGQPSSRQPKIDQKNFDKILSTSALLFSAGNQSYDVVLSSNNNLHENFTNRIVVEPQPLAQPLAQPLQPQPTIQTIQGTEELNSSGLNPTNKNSLFRKIFCKNQKIVMPPNLSQKSNKLS
jgi:hypothetical protein